jgi:mRNA interferase MazF
MEKDFDRWNEIKKRLARDAPLPPAFPKDGEVWMCSLGKNLGREQDGGSQDFSRPVLIVKKFNNEIFWVVPLSTKQKPLNFYFNYNDPSGAPVAAVLAQLRLVSINRLRRDIYVLPPALLDEVRGILVLKSKPRREAGFLEASCEALYTLNTIPNPMKVK